ARQLDKHATHTHMYRWMFNMATGEVKEFPLDDEVTEFPIISNDYVGKPYQYTYSSLFMPGHWLMTGIKKYDLKSGDMERTEYGDGRFGSEVCVALRDGYTAEDDGYVITFVNDMKADTSECVVYDAAHRGAGPGSRIGPPRRT